MNKYINIFSGILLAFAMLAFASMPAYGQLLEPLLERAIHHKASQKTDSLCHTYLQLGHFYMEHQVYGKAVEYYQKTESLAGQLNTQSVRPIDCQLLIAQAFAAWKKYPQAIRQYERLLAQYIPLQEFSKEKEARAQLSYLYKASNNLEASLGHNQKLLALAQQLGDKVTEINTLNNLGVIYGEQRQMQKASEQFEQALAINKSVELPVAQEVLLLENAAYHHLSLKNPSLAKRLYTQAQKLSEQQAYKAGMASSNNALAGVAFIEKRNEVAFGYAEKALEIAKEQGFTEQEVEANLILSKIYEAVQDTRQAQYYYKQHLEAQERLDLQEREQESKLIQKQLDAEKQENSIKLLLAEKEKQSLELRQLTLSAEAKARELEVNRQQVELLTKDKELQERLLENQALEQRRTALEKEKIKQALQLVQQEIEQNKQSQYIDSLQKSKEIEVLAQKEREKEIELLKANSDLQNERIKQQEETRTFNRILAALLGILLFITLAWLYQKQRSNKKLKESKIEVLQKNEELQASEEELKQNAEELLVVNERMAEEKQRTEEAMQKLQEAKNQMVQSEKMASLGQLTAGVAHEINNPVNFIAGGSQTLKTIMGELGELLALYKLLEVAETDEEKAIARTNISNFEQQVAPNEELQEDALAMLSDIEKGAARVTEIVLGLRNFSRSDTSERMEDNLHDNITNTLLILHSKYHGRVEIVKNLDDRIKYIECFPGQLSQVFMNIIGNGIDAIEGKGTIAITTQHLGEFVSISIKDSGKGMPESVRSRIFDPFFTTKAVGKGTGLGLSIVHGIIENHNGTIEVNSAEGEGSEFVITLPV